MKTYVFMAIPPCILLRMTNVSEESCRDHQDTHFMFNNFPPAPRIMPFMRLRGKMWHSQTDHALRSIRFALLDYKFIHFIKARDTYSEYVILIIFPRQQWLRERASMLCFMCIACLINFIIKCRTLMKLTRRMNTPFSCHRNDHFL